MRKAMCGAAAVVLALALTAGAWAQAAAKCPGVPGKKPYCSKCDKVLAAADVKAKKCAKDETEVVMVDVCTISSYIPTCHPNKASNKPTS